MTSCWLPSWSAPIVLPPPFIVARLNANLGALCPASARACEHYAAISPLGMVGNKSSVTLLTGFRSPWLFMHEHDRILVRIRRAKKIQPISREAATGRYHANALFERKALFPCVPQRVLKLRVGRPQRVRQ